MPIFQKLREEKALAQGHTARMRTQKGSEPIFSFLDDRQWRGFTGHPKAGTQWGQLAVSLPARPPPLGTYPQGLTERKAADTRLEGKIFLQRQTQRGARY